jgi:DNA (cytosine-5)-methyltransferase 1
VNGEIRVAELFAGIGGFRLGLENANNQFSRGQRKTIGNNQERMWNDTEQSNERQTAFRVVWANEWDKYACQIYRKNFGEKELVEGDICKVNTDQIPNVNLLVGGFPCQPHSLAGKRKGFGEERGTVFHEIIRVAQAKRPEMLLLENVKGLLSSEQGRAFGTVLEELGRIGYWCEWKTFNSKYFGVPQNRERVFIVGHLRGAGGKQIFPIGESSGVFRAEPESENICPTITSRYHKRGKTDPYIAILRDNLGGNIKNKLRTDYAWTLGGSETVILQEHSHSGPDGKGRGIRMFEDVCPTLASQMGTGGNNVPMVAQALQTDGFLRSGSSFGTDKPQSSRNIRRLTPTECERLQGFPDGWTNNVSDTQRYKTLGNAVTVPVIQAIGELILEQFSSSEVKSK